MENSFIGECAAYLYYKYGTEISNVKIVLPSKRASLFFNLALSRLIGNKPVWQPKFYSLDQIFRELSGLAVAERLKLLVVLYNVYSKYHKESFDQFYYWGDMLLNDFEAVDNYMVNAQLLFENSADIKDIELRFDYMPEEDVEEIRRFWRHFGETRNSEEKEYFFNIWKTLYPIYTEFREALLSEGIGYSGMICREVAEALLSDKKQIANSKHYALIGFNALSTTEKVLFDAMKESDFLWDSDESYLRSKNNEAGLFLRSNLERYGESNGSVTHDNFRKPKEITIVKSPSASMECKYVWEFLEKCSDSGRRTLGAETAIILTDESLLLPVLYSITPYITHFNVTAGYELRLTQAY
ncbi:MAG: PD-(D/E)XK nuclease family protein, partial [Rikenellaceae bacterium]